jgi:hypothetical protein
MRDPNSLGKSRGGGGPSAWQLVFVLRPRHSAVGGSVGRQAYALGFFLNPLHLAPRAARRTGRAARSSVAESNTSRLYLLRTYQ